MDINSFITGFAMGKKNGGSGGGDNTVIDVAELPTENVDETKIYRVTKETEPSAEIYIRSEGSSPMTVNEYVEAVYGAHINVTYYIVESLPETLLESNRDTETYHVYIISETGKPYIQVLGDVYDFVTDWFGFNLVNRGVISSIDEATQDGYYFCMSYGERTIYGIPDRENAKDTFEYTADGKWVERGGIIDATTLPSVNIKDGVAYRISSPSEMYVYDSWSGKAFTYAEFIGKYNGATVKTHVVDKLPEQMETTVPNSGGVINVYVVESTGVGYVTPTNSSADAVPLSKTFFVGEFFAPDMGIVNSMDGITQDGYYFVKGGYVSMHTHDDEGWTNYVSGEKYDKVVQEKDDLVADYKELGVENAIMGVKYNALYGCATDEAALNFVNKATIVHSEEYGVQISSISDKTITSIIIPQGVNAIASEVFSGCTALTSIVLPEGLTSIGYQAFKDCTSLTSVVFPSTFTYFDGTFVFRGCTAMQKYDFTASTQVVRFFNDDFKDMPASCKVIVPDALYDAWIATSGWSSLASRIVKASEAT